MTDTQEQQPTNPADDFTTKEWVLTLVKLIDDNQSERLHMLEERMEGIEKVQSQLTLAYAELASRIQALLEVSIDEIDVEAFNAAMKISWDEKMEAFQSGIHAANSSKPGFIQPESLQNLMTILLPKIDCIISESSRSAFAIVLNNYERRFVSTPQFLAQLYRYLVKKYPYIYHVRVVDDEVFKFLSHSDDVKITAYS